MSNSKLATYTNLTNKHSGLRTHKITKIVVHHMAGKMTARQCADYFVRTSRSVSSNYTIGWDGSVAMNVEEKNRAWTTGSSWVDNRAITIEVSNADNNGGDWKVTDKAYNALLDLVTDICRRNGITNCSYTGNTDGVLQKHEWYQNTNCPGKYLGSKFPEISRIVNQRLSGSSTSTSKVSASAKTYKLKSAASIYINAEDAKNNRNIKGVYKAGDYYIYNEHNGMINITKTKGVPGAWINPNGIQVKLPTKSINQVAKEVINGNFGNGVDRKRRLEKAGYNYDLVQQEVNRLVGIRPVKKSNTEVAREVINGDWGNGSERKRRLEEAGYNYNEVQAEVNRRLGY